MKVEKFPEGVAFWNYKKRLTILLLVPFYSFYPKYETRRAGCPIGLELVASELVAKHFNVIFVDACMSAYDQYTQQLNGTIRYGLANEQLELVLAQFDPQIVGITSLFSNQAGNVETTATIVRRVYPDAIIVEGGSHASGDVDEVLKSTNVDMVVNREGLVTLPELCLSIEQGQSNCNFTPCAGVSYKKEDGIIVHNPDRPFLPNFDNLAPRRLEITLHEMYDTSEHTGGSRRVRTGRHAYILSSMGCSLKCDFCRIWQQAGTIRYYSFDRLEKEVVALKAAGVTELVEECDMFFGDIPHAMKVAEIYSKHDMVWFEEGGLSMFKFMKPGHGLSHRDLTDHLTATHCYRYYAAIESANPISLEGSHKPAINADMDLAEEIIRYTAEKGIEVVGGFMLGFKGKKNDSEFEESFDDIRRTVEYAKRLRWLKPAGLKYVMLFIVTAIPGTPNYRYLKSIFPDLDLRTSHERAAFPVGGLTPQQLTDLRIQWMKEVNGDACMGIADRTKNWGL